MKRRRLRIVVLGLSITSSWGNGHATTYRALLRELAARGHQITFFERDVSWYADHRDLPNPSYARVELYQSTRDLKERFSDEVRDADLVILGSYVTEGVAVGRWVTQKAQGVTAFYDIDTPVTLAKLERNDQQYLSRDMIPQFDLYLSFTGGPTLDLLERKFRCRVARPLYCSFDPDFYRPQAAELQWDLGYMGTYSVDRQIRLEKLLLQTAQCWRAMRGVVAGPQYPGTICWPENVERIEHLPPARHRSFYCSQRFTLNLTRDDMVRAGWAPSVRLFEAAACGSAIISDYWQGLEDFFDLGEEILVASRGVQVLDYIRKIPEKERRGIAARARRRVLSEHTSAHRAAELESYIFELLREQTVPDSRKLISGRAAAHAAKGGSPPLARQLRRSETE